jgi:hypothetical protein
LIAFTVPASFVGFNLANGVPRIARLQAGDRLGNPAVVQFSRIQLEQQWAAAANWATDLLQSRNVVDTLSDDVAPQRAPHCFHGSGMATSGPTSAQLHYLENQNDLVERATGTFSITIWLAIRCITCRLRWVFGLHIPS